MVSVHDRSKVKENVYALVEHQKSLTYFLCNCLMTFFSFILLFSQHKTQQNRNNLPEPFIPSALPSRVLSRETETRALRHSVIVYVFFILRHSHVDDTVSVAKNRLKISAST